VAVRGFHHSKGTAAVPKRFFLIDIVVAGRCNLLMISKKFSPLFFSAVVMTTALVSLSDLRAGASNKSGNPYGNGTFFPNTGTFSAILRSTNGFLGVVQFTTGSTNGTLSGSTNSGVAAVYADGIQYLGSAFGAINTPAQTIAVTYSGVAGSLITQLPTLVATAPAIVTSDTNATIPFTYTSGVTNFSSSNSCNGSFQANLQNSYPNQIFSGQGQATARFSTLTYSIVPAINNTPAYINYTPTNFIVPYVVSVQGSRLN
jgi:hypothetical protein